MSELSKLLQSTSVAANPANPAKPLAEISKISNFSKRGDPNVVFGSRNKLRVLAGPDWGKSPLVRSVDQVSKELRESPNVLREAAQDDWDEVSNDPAQLVAFADSLAIVQIRESGGVPDTYVSVTTCQNCGEVPIWLGCPPMVKECPWCMNGLTAPPIPSINE